MHNRRLFDVPQPHPQIDMDPLNSAPPTLVQRVHIVGAPRSGTTLMLEMMLGAYAFDAFAREEMSVLTPPPADARTTCTKLPRDVVLAAVLLPLDPGQWFIYILRDPRDVIVSLHGLDPSRYWASLWYWRRAHAFAQKAQGHPRFIEIRYEDLVQEPDRVQRELEARIPFLERQAAFSSFHQRALPSTQSIQAMRFLRPVDPSSIGAWRSHLPRVAGQILHHGSPTPELVALGYEQDEGWEAILAGVEPDLRPSRLAERPTQEKLQQSEAKNLAGLASYLVARGLSPSAYSP